MSDITATIPCNNRGDCISGKCECYSREDPQEFVSGDYCELDNFSCDRYNKYNSDPCFGEYHGVCQCESCVWIPGWGGSAGYISCNCRSSNETCITPRFLLPKYYYPTRVFNPLCSGHGTCECGNCKCEEISDGQYSGQYCEDFVWLQKRKEGLFAIHGIGFVLGVVGAGVVMGFAILLICKIVGTTKFREVIAKFKKKRQLEREEMLEKREKSILQFSNKLAEPSKIQYM